MTELAKDMTAADAHVSSTEGEKKPKGKPKAKPAKGKNERGEESMEKFETGAKVLKVDDSLGLVLGWAIVSNQGGEPYFDLQGDHIPEDAMLSASVDFMQHSRVAKEMHAGEQVGDIVFAFPMTADIAEAFSIETQTTGLMIAMRPSDPDILQKYRDGEFTGFSIGGFRIEDEEVD